MSRNLLHKNRLDEFLEWCTKKDIINCKINSNSIDEYRVAGIKVKNKDDWRFIYKRLVMPEHYTIDWRLEPLVRNFIKETRKSLPKD
jgi:hypothetical protein